MRKFSYYLSLFFLTSFSFQSIAQKQVDCQGEFTKMTSLRTTLTQKLNKMSGEKASPVTVCNDLNKLFSLEKRIFQWVNKNKEWCQIPDNIAVNVKKSAEGTAKIAQNVCLQAEQYIEMEKNKQGQSLTPRFRIPSGPL